MELTSRRDFRFRVPLAIQTTKYRAYLRHAYVFLRSLPRQWNCRAAIVRPDGTKIQDLILTPMRVSPRPTLSRCHQLVFTRHIPGGTHSPQCRRTK